MDLSRWTDSNRWDRSVSSSPDRLTTDDDLNRGGRYPGPGEEQAAGVDERYGVEERRYSDTLKGAGKKPEGVEGPASATMAKSVDVGGTGVRESDPTRAVVTNAPSSQEAGQEGDGGLI